MVRGASVSSESTYASPQMPILHAGDVDGMGTPGDIGWVEAVTARRRAWPPRWRRRGTALVAHDLVAGVRRNRSWAPDTSGALVRGNGRPWLSRRRSRLTRRKNEEVSSRCWISAEGRQSVTLATLS